jgi:hypothetical protein
VAVISDLVTIARDRAAIVLAPTLSVPGSIVGLDAGIDIVDYSENAERDLAEAV